MHCYGLSQWITDRFAAVVEVFFFISLSMSKFSFYILFVVVVVVN